MKETDFIINMKNIGKCVSTPGGTLEILKNVNLSISPGEFVMISGPSGSGKSSLLHLAAMIDTPTSGEIIFDKLETTKLNEAKICTLRKWKIGMVFQNYCLLPQRSVLENVLFRFRYLNYNQSEAKEKAYQALETVGLTSIADRRARLLSGGEMQRVAIARAIALEPRLLVADEPTGNLDYNCVNTIMECFSRLNQAGITILMVTHNENLLRFSTRNLKCKGGMIECSK